MSLAQKSAAFCSHKAVIKGYKFCGSFCKIVQRKEAFKMKQDQRFWRKNESKLKERNCRRLKLEAILS